MMALATGLLVIALLGILRPPMVFTDRPRGSVKEPRLCWIKVSVWGGMAAAAVWIMPFVLRGGGGGSKNGEMS